MSKKKAKKKAKRKLKQPTKAEIEAQHKRYEQELQDEADLLPRLADLEFHTRAAAKMGPTANLASDLLTLIRMFKRKHLEARELRGYLLSLKGYFEECWDEEDEHFDASYAEKPGHFVPGHWCPNLIEEIGEMVQEGTVYSPLPIPTPQEV